MHRDRSCGCVDVCEEVAQEDTDSDDDFYLALSRMYMCLQLTMKYMYLSSVVAVM